MVKKKHSFKTQVQHKIRDTLKAFQVSFVSLLLLFPLLSLYKSWRVQQVVDPETQALFDSGQPVIFAFWHGRMYTTFRVHPFKKVTILISPSTDGEMIARMMQRFGFDRFVRGSHKRQGTQALRAMLREVRYEKRSLFFMVDGPRGPRYQVKPGIIRLAGQTQVPIIPIGSAAKFFWMKMTRSWDHFNIPFYFTPMQIVFGKPFYVPKGLTDAEEIESYRQGLETEMRGLTQQAEAVFGTQEVF